jgi:2-alkenal reductase
MNRVGILLAVMVSVVALALGAGAVAGGLTALWLIDQNPGRLAGVGAPLPLTGARIEQLANGAAPPPDAAVAAQLAAVRATRPAVVTVWNLQRARRNGQVVLTPVTSGSGVIFDRRGYIATNTHVLEGAEAVQVVFLDGRRATAQLVRFDPQYDVALLQVDAALVPAVAPLADSSQLEPGMPVVAIGSPLGTEYQNTVTQGIIAGLNRRVKQPLFDWSSFSFREQELVDAPLIQTDAAINSGNSGGPLVNMKGEVVGLNTLIVRSNGRQNYEGLGFAIPANVIRALTDEWIDGQRRGALGITFDTLDPLSAAEGNLTRGTGALVTAVQPGTSAAAAGLQLGDIITGIDGVTLDLDHALADLLWRYRAGDRVHLTLERGEAALAVDVTLDAAPTTARTP